MYSARVTVWTLLLTCLITPAAVAQSFSSIGKFLDPWGNYEGAQLISVTPDGWIAFMEQPDGYYCFGGTDVRRISIIRDDGTDYRVVLDWPDIVALPGSDWKNWFRTLKLAGGGKTLSFSTWEMTGVDELGCQTGLGSSQHYLVDVDTGSTTLFKFNGMDVWGISYSDDGTKMSFGVLGTSPIEFYVSDVDGSNATKIPDTSPLPLVSGVLTGDGNKFLMTGAQAGGLKDVYLFDLPTQTLTKVSPVPLAWISGLSCSYDGSRVIYHQNAGPIHAVNGDGTGHHILSSDIMGGWASGTITRDGEWVFVAWVNAMGDNTTYRINWDGTVVEEVAPKTYHSGSFTNPQPVNADGSVFAYHTWAGVPFKTANLTLSLLSPPALTTYGYGNPGTPLTWDVGGEPGDSYILVFSFGLLPTRVPTQYGLLQLDPTSLFVLASGPILGPNNVGSVQVTIPASLNLPVPVPLHSQAVVLPPGGGGALTNMTTVVLQNAP